MFSAKHSKELGIKGEQDAASYISKLGYSLLYKNYKIGNLEIDIVARDPFDVLVFLEVKAGELGRNFFPEDHLTKSKIQKIQNAGRVFVAKHPELIRDDAGWRVDAITLTYSAKDCKVRYYENI